MLFRKNIEPRCAYCAHAGRIDDNEVACPRKGIVPAGGSCRRFKYDPLKRIPPKPGQLVMKNVNDEDLSFE